MVVTAPASASVAAATSSTGAASWGLLAPGLALAYRRALARIQAQILHAVLRQFRLSGSWRNTDAVEFVSIVPPLVRGAQQAVSAITAAYLDRVASEASGVRTPPQGIAPSEVTGSAVRAGVDPAVVYRRPYTVAWTELAAGAPLPQALQRAERRIGDLVSTDLQLAKTHTAQRVLSRDNRVVGWVRVPQGTYSCALCLITSTVRYTKQKLAPIHPNCDCLIEPLVGSYDPGPVINADFLDAVHDAIERDLGSDYVAESGRRGSTQARELSYRDIVIEHQHGEIGPVLAVRGHGFTGPADIRWHTTHQKIER